MIDDAKNEETTAAMPSWDSGASRDHEGGADGEGSTFSNTDPSGTNTRVYRHGVDSIYLSYRGALSIDSINILEEKKKAAQSEDPTVSSTAQLSVAGHNFEVLDKGSAPFAFVLKDKSVTQRLSKTANSPAPMAYFQVSSEYLTLSGLKAVVDDLDNVVGSLGHVLSEAAISRLDLCVDFSTNFDIETLRSDDFVTKCEDFATFEKKPEVTGISIGMGGDISARLYNKIVELRKKPRPYLLELWHKAGWDGKKTVWRLEFQIKREALKGLGIDTVSDLFKTRASLWEYLSTEWLRVVQENPNDTHRDRWPIHPFWKPLTTVFEGEGSFPLSERFSNRRVPEEGKIIRRITSGIASFMAIKGYNKVSSALMNFASDADSYYARVTRFEETFASSVTKKLAEKCKQYNVPLPDQQGHNND